MKQPDNTDGAAGLAQIQLINVAAIVPDPNNRKDIDKAALRVFADEILVDGLLQPIVVRPVDDGKFQLVAGERRWRAFQLLEREAIPATVLQGEVPKTATRKRVAENFHRVDLTPIEKARDLEQLFKDGMSQTEVAAFVGAKDQSTISNMMRLLKLPKKVQAWLQDGSLNAAQGKALLRFEGRDKLVEAIAERAIDQGAPSKLLEKGLPFANALAEDGFVHDFEWAAGSINDLPKEYRSDSDFIEAEDEYGNPSVFCLDLKKGKLVHEILRKEGEARNASRASNSSSRGEGGGMSKAESAARKKKIDQNQTARLATSALGHRVLARLAAVRDIDAPAVAVVAAEAIAHCGDCEELAEQLGIALPREFDGYDPTCLAKLKPADAIRLAAACIAQRQTDEAMRYAKPPQEDVLTLASADSKDAEKVVETWKIRIKALVLCGTKVAEIQKELGIPEYLAINLSRLVKREAKLAPPKPVSSAPAREKAKKFVPVGAKKKRGARAVITDETRAQVKRGVMDGRTGAEIAKLLGISLPSVQNIKKALGLVRRSK